MECLNEGVVELRKGGRLKALRLIVSVIERKGETLKLMGFGILGKICGSPLGFGHAGDW